MFPNHRQSSYLPTKCTNSIKVLNCPERSITRKEALARRERRARCWPCAPKDRCRLDDIHKVSMVFIRVQGLAKSSALLCFKTIANPLTYPPNAPTQSRSSITTNPQQPRNKRRPDENAEPGAGHCALKLRCFLMLFTRFILFFNGFHGLAKSSALLPFVSKPLPILSPIPPNAPNHQGP